MIPRGGESLVKMVEKEAKMPSITGGIGVTHLYIDPSANINKAISVTFNSNNKLALAHKADVLLGLKLIYFDNNLIANSNSFFSQNSVEATL